MTLVAGPPVGWDPTEATERVRAVTHAYPEHIAWLAEMEEGKRVNRCWRCDGPTL